MPTNSLFEESWWLEATAPGSWGAVEVRENGAVVARMPYVRKRRLRWTLIGQPALTPVLGPWLAPVEGKYGHRLDVEKDRMSELIARLPRFDYFRQSFSPRVTNWLPFYWAGFNATVRYTYRLDDLSDPERLWHAFAENVRRQIRKTEKQVAVRTDRPLDDLLPLNVATFRRKRLEPPREALLRRIDEACAARGARTAFFAEDAQGRLHAAIYVVHDERAAFYLLGGRSDEFATSGATSLLMWEAIKQAAATSQAFDFEGSMIESVERFFRAFGGRQVPYFRVEKAQGVLRPVLAARQLVRPE